MMVNVMLAIFIVPSGGCRVLRVRWVVITFMSFAMIGLSFWLIPIFTSTGPYAVLFTVARELVGYGPQCLLALWGIRREWLWTNTRLRVTSKKLWSGAVLGLAVFLVILVTGYQAVPWRHVETHLSMFIRLFLTLALLTGPIEELFFRGYLFTRWAEHSQSKRSLMWFAVATSLIFAAFHVFRDATSLSLMHAGSGIWIRTILMGMSGQFLMGLVQTACYWNAYNIVYGMTIHTLYDFAIYLGLFREHPDVLVMYIVLALLGTFVVRRLSVDGLQVSRPSETLTKRRKTYKFLWWLYTCIVLIAGIAETVQDTRHGFNLWKDGDLIVGGIEMIGLIMYVARGRSHIPLLWRWALPLFVVYDSLSSYEQSSGWSSAATNTLAGLVMSLPIYIALYRLGCPSVPALHTSTTDD